MNANIYQTIATTKSNPRIRPTAKQYVAEYNKMKLMTDPSPKNNFRRSQHDQFFKNLDPVGEVHAFSPQDKIVQKKNLQKLTVNVRSQGMIPL